MAPELITSSGATAPEVIEVGAKEDRPAEEVPVAVVVPLAEVEGVAVAESVPEAEVRALEAEEKIPEVTASDGDACAEVYILQRKSPSVAEATQTAEVGEVAPAVVVLE